MFDTGAESQDLSIKYLLLLVVWEEILKQS